MKGSEYSGPECMQKKRKRLFCSCKHLLATGLLLSSTLVTLLGDGELDTTATGHRDHGLAIGADDEDVGETGGEVTAKDIADVDNVEATKVTLLTGNNTGTALVTTTSAHNKTSDFERKRVDNLVLDQVKFDGVVDLDDWVRVTDGATVMSYNEGYTLVSKLNTFDFAKLVSGFFSADSVDGKSALDVEHDTEVFAGFFDGDDIYGAAKSSTHADERLRRMGAHP